MCLWTHAVYIAEIINHSCKYSSLYACWMQQPWNSNAKLKQWTGPCWMDWRRWIHFLAKLLTLSFLLRHIWHSLYVGPCETQTEVSEEEVFVFPICLLLQELLPSVQSNQPSFVFWLTHQTDYHWGFLLTCPSEWFDHHESPACATTQPYATTTHRLQQKLLLLRQLDTPVLQTSSTTMDLHVLPTL